MRRGAGMRLNQLAGLFAVFALAACNCALDDATTLSADTGDVRVCRDGKPPFAEGKGRFVLTDWGGPDIPVWTYAPTQADLTDRPIVIVMHGTGRDADRYRDEWAALAQLNRFIVVAPEFSDRRFPNAAGYNLGNVFQRNGVDVHDEAAWSFSAIEPLFDAVVGVLDSDRTDYTLYGHSAGSQFVHRFLFHKPDARASRIIAANAGWYTMPDFDQAFPYGLGGSVVEDADVATAFGKDVVVLLGDLDSNAEHPSLRRTPEAMLQGPHRFARGQAFYQFAKERAEALDAPFGWRMQVVPYAKHSNGEMALAAAELIR